MLPPDSHLIGDGAYSLSSKLLVPFKDNGHLTNIQKGYNKKLSQTRVVIENSFALLKARFRRLKLLEAVKPENISLIIISACILHNVCLSLEGIPFNLNIEQELNEERVMNPPIFLAEEGNNHEAIGKRNDIANALHFEDLHLPV